MRSIESRAPLVLSGSLTTCTTISWPGLSRSVIWRAVAARPRPRRGASTPGSTISSTCRKPFFSRPMSTNAASRPGEHVVDAALVDVADDRAGAAALEVELGDAVAGGGIGGPLAAAGARRWWLVCEAAGSPVPSSSATRVSPRSTLTNTCFFNLYSFEFVSPRLEALRLSGAAAAERVRSAAAVRR